MKAFLLAAGFGTRFRPYTEQLAKPAIPFLNLPLIAYPLYLLEQLKVTDTIINTHHLPQTVHKAVDKLQKHLTTKIHYSHEEPEILKSGGGLKKVKDHFKVEENFIFANADALMQLSPQGLAPLIEKHQQEQALATLLTCEHPGVGTKFGGVWINEQNHILDIGKQAPNEQAKALHYTGYMILNKKVFDYVPDQDVSHIFMDILLPAIASSEKIIAHQEAISWYETGDLENYHRASESLYKALQQGQSASTIKETTTYFQADLKQNQPEDFKNFY